MIIEYRHRGWLLDWEDARDEVGYPMPSAEAPEVNTEESADHEIHPPAA
jgi:hypothetical protein